MDVLSSVKSFPGHERSVVALGMFDGMHRGHVKVVEEVGKEGDKRSAPKGIVTFWPHPSRVLQGSAAPPVLMTRDQKMEFLEKMGMDFAVVLAFTKEFAGTDPEVFFEESLVAAMDVQCIVVGEDYVFGREGRGDVSLLRALGKGSGVDVVSVPPVMGNGERISSSWIRTLIMDSQLDRAERLLGRPYVVWGVVVQGKRRGAGMGFPTANLLSGQEVLPKNGVYIGETKIEDEIHLSLVNVGTCPTFRDVAHRRLESHLLSREGDLYGKRCGVRFLKRLREERAFENKKALMVRMNEDKAAAIEWSVLRGRNYPAKAFYPSGGEA